MRTISATATLAVFFASLSLSLQSSYAATSIDGVPVSCFALNGRLVQEISQPGIGDAAKATMMPGPMGPVPVIIMDPTIMATFGPDTQARLFIYAHECGHQALGHTIMGMTIYSEMQADCWGIKIGRDQGWFDMAAINREGTYFANNPGDPWGHLPGPQRVANFARCFADPMTAAQYQQQVVSARMRGAPFY